MFIPKFTIQEATPQDIGKNLRLIHVEKFWTHSKGDGVVVAVIDTGIDTTHAEFAGRIYKTYNTITGGAVFDGNGHGTHVAGIIGGKTVGVAPEARIMAIKAFSDDGKSSQGVEDALLYVLDHNKKCAEADKVVVVNCSFSSSAYSGYMAYLIRQLVNSGVSVVVSAGNQGDGRPETSEAYSYPAFIHEVITVAATDQDGEIAPYGNSFDGIDLTAPGTKIYSACPGGGYVLLTGTSMSAPHVSGALALIYGLYRKTYGKWPTTDQAEEILWQNVTDYGSDPRLVGRGLLELKHPEAFPTPEVIKMTVGQDTAVVDGKTISLVAPPIIKDSRAYLGVRDLNEILVRQVEWVEWSDQYKEIISTKK